MSSHCIPGTEPPVGLSYFSSACSLALSIIISFGNFAIVLAIAKDPNGKLRTPFAFFLVNVAISDFAVGALAMPISTVVHFKEARKQGTNACTVTMHITYFISASASLVSIIAMAIDRYITINSTTVRRPTFTRRNYIAMSLLIWALAIGFSGFSFITRFVTLAYIYVCASLIFAFGITLITYFRVLIRMRRISTSVKQQGQMGTSGHKDQAALRENKVTEIFVALLLAYIGIHFPVFILINLVQFCVSCHCTYIHVFRDLFFLLISAASAINPVVCLLKMQVIRKSLLALVKCGRQSSQEPCNTSGHIRSN